MNRSQRNVPAMLTLQWKSSVRLLEIKSQFVFGLFSMFVKLNVSGWWPLTPHRTGSHTYRPRSAVSLNWSAPTASSSVSGNNSQRVEEDSLRVWPLSSLFGGSDVTLHSGNNARPECTGLFFNLLFPGEEASPVDVHRVRYIEKKCLFCFFHPSAEIFCFLRCDLDSLGELIPFKKYDPITHLNCQIIPA